MQCRRATLMALVALLVSLCALGVLYRACSVPSGPRGPRGPSGPSAPSAPRAPVARSGEAPGDDSCDGARAPRAVFTHSLLPFTQIGLLESAGKEPVALFGRPTRRGSDRWNYFAVTSTYRPQKLPVFVRGVDAAKLAGCAELSDGEIVDVRGYGSAKVALYTLDDAEHRFSLRA